MNEADFDLGDLGEGVRLAHPKDSTPGDAKGTPVAASDAPSGPTAQSSIPPEMAIELLSKISLFSALQPTYLRRIATLGLEEDYAQDALIFKEGAVGDKVYLI